MSFYSDARDLFGLSRSEADDLRDAMGDAYDWDDVTDWGEDASLELEDDMLEVELDEWVYDDSDYFMPGEEYEISFEYEEAK